MLSRQVNEIASSHFFALVSCKASLCKWSSLFDKPRFVARRTRNQSSADFQVCCVADFQIRRPAEFHRAADLEVGDTAGLETCATSFARLSMTLSVLPASCRQKRLGSADETSAARCRGVHLCALTPRTALSFSAKDGAHGVTRPTS